MDTAGFENVARRYVAAIEAANSVDEITRALAGLYASALESLGGSAIPGEQDIPTIPELSWQQLFDALARLLKKTWYHDIVTDQFDLGTDPGIATGDLADDLADTWRDVKAGLMAVDQGMDRETVDWHWAFSFRTHWGKHAARAMAVLHDFGPGAEVP